MLTPHSLPIDNSVDEGIDAAVPVRVTTLTKRADFLRASRARHIATPGFILQKRVRSTDSSDGIRVGFTCSKKVGNAVARNRAKRRLREIARLILPVYGENGSDYVLIGRAGATETRSFELLLADFQRALLRLHRQR